MDLREFIKLLLFVQFALLLLLSGVLYVREYRVNGAVAALTRVSGYFFAGWLSLVIAKIL